MGSSHGLAHRRVGQLDKGVWTSSPPFGLFHPLALDIETPSSARNASGEETRKEEELRGAGSALWLPNLFIKELENMCQHHAKGVTE